MWKSERLILADINESRFPKTVDIEQRIALMLRIDFAHCKVL